MGESIQNGHNGHVVDLSAALDQAYFRYTAKNPKSYEYFKAGETVFPGGNTRSIIHAMPFPLTIERGEAHKLYTVDGHEYIDLLNEYSAGIYGHTPRPIQKAIASQLEQGWALGGHNVHQNTLAKMLLERYSNSMDKIRFTNSGTEANLMAVGACLNYTQRKKILAFARGYHGSAFSFPSDDPNYKNSMNPHYDFTLAPYNDIAATEAVLASMPPNSLGAVIVEPMQGAGGCIPATPEFLRFLREVTEKLGAMLIIDEVMTSRCAWGGLQSKLDFKPDMLTIGKWAGGGLSFGAFGGRNEIMEMFNPRNRQLVHNGTFNNNVITMLAGVAGCTMLDHETMERMNSLGDRTREQILLSIKKVLGASPKPKLHTTGVGSLLNVTFEGSDQAVLQSLFYHHVLEHGIIIATRGYVALSIVLTEEHCARFVLVVEDFLVKYKEALL